MKTKKVTFVFEWYPVYDTRSDITVVVDRLPCPANVFPVDTFVSAYRALEQLTPYPNAYCVKNTVGLCE